jgi:hypothetical protein
MTGTTNPYMALLEEEEQRRQVTLGAALLTGLDVSPDAHAAQRRDAVTLGVPTAAVAADPRGSAMEAQAIRIKADTAKHPALQQRYTDDDFRRLAHDDSGALARLGDWVANSTRYVMGAERDAGTVARRARAGHGDRWEPTASARRRLRDARRGGEVAR